MSKRKEIFLVAQYHQKPRPGVNTSVAGWKNDPNNVSYDEQVLVTSKLKPRDINAQVILNLSTKTVQKNTYNDRPFDEIFKYFFANYHQYIIEVMGKLDPEYLEQIVTELEQEMAQAEAEEAAQSVPVAEYTEVKPDENIQAA